MLYFNENLGNNLSLAFITLFTVLLIILHSLLYLCNVFGLYVYFHKNRRCTPKKEEEKYK